MILLAILATLAGGAGLLGVSPTLLLLLRAIVCACSCVGIAAARRARSREWVWIYAALAVLYNPILVLPIRSRSMWGALALAALVVLWSGALRFRGGLGAAPVRVKARKPKRRRRRPETVLPGSIPALSEGARRLAQTVTDEPKSESTALVGALCEYSADEIGPR